MRTITQTEQGVIIQLCVMTCCQKRSSAVKSFKKSPTAAKRRFRKQYPWAFRGTTRTPSAFALPKRKKEFLSGRLIVSFVRAFTHALLEASARLLYQLTAIAFPESFASGDVYELLRVQDCFSHLQDPNGLGLSQSGHLGFFHKRIAGSIFPSMEAFSFVVSAPARRQSRHDFHCGPKRKSTTLENFSRNSQM